MIKDLKIETDKLIIRQRNLNGTMENCSTR